MKNGRGNKTAPVSVVIPCFRCADVIKRAVGSIVAQTVRPVEVILVDDAGGDATLSALYDMQKLHGENLIRVLRMKKNGGPSAARNAGWNAASGKYIAFLDADDAWHPRKIEIQHGWMAAHPKVALTGHRCAVLSGETLGFPVEKPLRTFRLHPSRLLFTNLIPTRSAMIRKELPFRFDPSKKHSEDYLLWLEISLNGNDVRLLDPILGYSFKAQYGQGGLTKNLRDMEKGEIDTYRKLHRKGLVTGPVSFFLIGFSLLKYLRRLLIVRFSRRFG